MSFYTKENEPGLRPESEPKWRKAYWEGWECWAKPFDETEDNWEVSIELPEDTETNSVKINYVPDEIGVFTIQYKLKERDIFQFIVVPLETEEGNGLATFGVHIGSDLERTFQMNEYELKSREPSEL